MNLFFIFFIPVSIVSTVLFIFLIYFKSKTYLSTIEKHEDNEKERYEINDQKLESISEGIGTIKNLLSKEMVFDASRYNQFSKTNIEINWKTILENSGLKSYKKIEKGGVDIFVSGLIYKSMSVNVYIMHDLEIDEILLSSFCLYINEQYKDVIFEFLNLTTYRSVGSVTLEKNGNGYFIEIYYTFDYSIISSEKLKRYLSCILDIHHEIKTYCDEKAIPYEMPKGKQLEILVEEKNLTTAST